MRLHLCSVLEVTGIVGDALVELGRDTARSVVGWLCNRDDPVQDVNPTDDTAAA